MKNMFKETDLRFVISFIVLFTVGVLTCTGHMQQVVPFEHAGAEMFFAFTTFMGSIFCLILSDKKM